MFPIMGVINLVLEANILKTSYLKFHFISPGVNSSVTVLTAGGKPLILEL
jgi:hypothetical protein